MVRLRILALLCVLAAPGFDSTAVSASLQFGDQVFQGLLSTAHAPSFSQVCAQSSPNLAFGGIVNSPCSGGLLIPGFGSVGTFIADIAATGSIANGLSLGFSAGLSTTQTALSSSSDVYEVVGQGAIVYRDTVTAFGGLGGQPGFLNLRFATDGTTSCSSLAFGNTSCPDHFGAVQSSPDFRGFHFPSGTAFTGGGLTVSNGALGVSRQVALENGDNRVAIAIPIIFGQSFDLGISMSGEVETIGFGADQLFANLSFLNTVAVVGLDLEDSSGNILSGALISSSGASLTPNAIPEPATLLLTSLGALAGGITRRRRRSTR